MTSLMAKLLIVIPAYNEEENIVQVVGQLAAVCPQYDYVVVNDGSRDRTAALCRQHGFRLIDLPINLGLAGAFQTGLRYAAENGYDCALQFDADGQHCPEYIQPMLDLLEQGADIVIGSRFVTVKKPRNLRMVGSYLISWAIRLTTRRARGHWENTCRSTRSIFRKAASSTSTSLWKVMYTFPWGFT